MPSTETIVNQPSHILPAFSFPRDAKFPAFPEGSQADPQPMGRGRPWTSKIFLPRWIGRDGEGGNDQPEVPPPLHPLSIPPPLNHPSTCPLSTIPPPTPSQPSLPPLNQPNPPPPFPHTNTNINTNKICTLYWQNCISIFGL